MAAADAGSPLPPSNSVRIFFVGGQLHSIAASEVLKKAGVRYV